MIKVAVLWLFNESGELLLAQRAYHKKQDPGVWGPSVTGKLEDGETSEQALLREAEEELSLRPDQYMPVHLLEVEFPHPDGELRVFSIYSAKVPSQIIHELKSDDNEVAKIEWRNLKSIKDLIHSDKTQLVPSAQEVWPATFEAMSST